MAADDNMVDEPVDILNAIVSGSDKRGDLPIFNASVAQVRKLSHDPDAHTMELAQTILRDANLAAKILRIANSPFYSRGLGKISSVSRAVVLLGFDTIRNLCVTLKLIESFESDHPAVSMNQLVARSYITAGFVRDLAIKCGSKEAEETYICGLLQGLGEIAAAYFMPGKFNAALKTYKEKKGAWSEIQREFFGVEFGEVGQRLAASWNFAPRITNTLVPFDKHHRGPVRNRDELSHALASKGADIVGRLFLEQTGDPRTLRELLTELSEITGIRVERLENSLTESYQASVELAKDYGLGNRVLLPMMQDTGDDLRDRLAREFGFHASTQGAPKPGASSPTNGAAATTATGAATAIDVGGAGHARQDGAYTPQNDPAATATPVGAGTGAVHNVAGASPAVTTPTAPATRGDPFVQLAIIQEITTMVTGGESLNKLLVKIMEGLQKGVGFERIVLSLVTPDRSGYIGRIALGKDTDNLRLAVGGSMNEANMFTKVLLDGGDLFVANIADGSWNHLMTPEVAKKIGVPSFILGGIRSGMKPIGFFYADNGTTNAPITPDQTRGFAQFVAQARLAVQIRGS